MRVLRLFKNRVFGPPQKNYFCNRQKFAVAAEGIYDRKIEFIQAGNICYTRKSELPGLFDAAQRSGVCLDHRPVKQSNEGVFSVAAVRSKTG